MIHVVSQRPGIAHGFIETEVEALPGALRGFASCVTRIGQGGVAIARQQRVRRSSAGLARVKRSTDCRRRQGSPGASARPWPRHRFKVVGREGVGPRVADTSQMSEST